MAGDKKIKQTNTTKPHSSGWVKLALAGFAFLIYANSIPNGYNMDDELVTINHRLTSKGIKGIPEIFTSYYYEDDAGYKYEWRPMVHVTFAIEHSIFGDNAQVSHFINVLLYSLLVMVLFVTLQKVFYNYNYLFPLIISVLFAAHPLHTEVVASIKNRDEILSLLAGLGAMYYLLKAQESKQPTGKIGFMLLVAVLFTAALMSKRSIVSFAAILPVTLILFRKPNYPILLATGVIMAVPAGFFAPFFYLWQVALFGFMVGVAPSAVKFVWDKDYLLFFGWLKRLSASVVKGIQRLIELISKLLRKLFQSILQIFKGTIEPFQLMVQKSDGDDDSEVASNTMATKRSHLIVFWGITLLSTIGLAVGIVLTELLLYKALLGVVLLVAFQLAGDKSKFNVIYWASFIVLVLNINFAIEALIFVGLSLLIIPIAAKKYKAPVAYILAALFIAEFFWMVPLIQTAVLTLIFSGALVLMYAFRKNIIAIVLLSILAVGSLLGNKEFEYLTVFYALLIPTFLVMRHQKWARALGTYVLLLLVFALSFNDADFTKGIGLGVPWREAQVTKIPVPPEYVEPTPPGPAIVAPQVVPQAGRKLEYIENPLAQIDDPATRVAVSFYVMGKYLQLMVFPHPLSFYYGYEYIPVVGLDNIWVILSIVLHIVLVLLALFLLKKHKVISYAIFFYLVAILPFSNLVVDVAGLMGERFAFVATLGFCIALGYLIAILLKAPLSKDTLVKWRFIPIPLRAVLIVLVVAYSLKVVVRNTNWKDYLTLFRHDIEHLEKSSVANNLIANHIIAAANVESNQNKRFQLYDEARKHYKKAVAIYPDFLNAWVDLGRMEVRSNRMGDAIEAYKQVIRIDTTFADAYFQIGILLEQQDKVNQAIPFYEAAIQYKPELISAYANLSFIYFKKGDIEKSIEINEMAIQSNPNEPIPYVNIGKTYLYIHEDTRALPYLEKAYQLNGDPELASIITGIKGSPPGN